MEIMNILSKFTVGYKKLRVTLKLNPRRGRCEACGRRMKTQRHHWFYIFKKGEVKKNPELALVCTNEYCFACHRLADVIRKWFASKGRKKTHEIIDMMFDHIEEAKKTKKKVRINHNKAVKKWRKNNPEKYNAHKKCNRIPIKDECELCPDDDKRTKNLERHHPDYSEPTFFVTICNEHHKWIHHKDVD